MLVDVVHRHHMISARTHFERVVRDSSASVVCGVGFADLSGFTALTQMLTPPFLSLPAPLCGHVARPNGKVAPKRDFSAEPSHRCRGKSPAARRCRREKAGLFYQ